MAFREVRRIIYHATKSMKALKAIPEIDFKKCFDDWKNVGIRALYQEGITLKGMKLIWINK